MTPRPFIKSYLDVLESDAWHYLGINARRFIDFLMVENMRRGGKHNGDLKAPRQQLEAYGIAARHISSAIDDAERVGLVDCYRGSGRAPNLYALTWLPLADGSPPSDRWRTYIRVSEGKSQSGLMTSEGIPSGYPKGSHKGRSDFRREVTRGQNKGIRREAPYKKALTTEEPPYSVVEGKQVGGPQYGKSNGWPVSR